MKASGRKMKEKMFLASIVIISKCRECCHAIAKMDIRVQFPLGTVCINFVFYVCESSISTTADENFPPEFRHDIYAMSLNAFNPLQIHHLTSNAVDQPLIWGSSGSTGNFWPITKFI